MKDSNSKLRARQIKFARGLYLLRPRYVKQWVR